MRKAAKRPSAQRARGVPERAFWGVAAALIGASCGSGDDRELHRLRAQLDAGAIAPADCGLPIQGFLDDLKAALAGKDGREFALGETPREIFALLDALGAGASLTSYPSLAGLGPAEQRMTVAASAIQLEAHFTLNCAQLRRLSHGGQKTVADLAQVVNLVANSPLSANEVSALPFERQYLVWEIARANDLGEGLNAQAHQNPTSNGGQGQSAGDDRVMSQPSTVVANPVKQLFGAFAGAQKGRDEFPPGGAEDAAKRWIAVTREQARLDQLLFELGDHAPPAAVTVEPVQSPTNRGTVLLSGSTESGALVHVAGGAAPSVAVADTGGHFSAAVQLVQNVENLLSVSAEDSAGNFGPAVTVSIRQDSVPPMVAVGSPADGLLTDSIVIEVTGSATDDVALAAVRINGSAATLAGSSFIGPATLTVGSNLIQVEAEDAAGNLAAATVTIQHQRPLAFGLIGAAGGTVTVPQAGATGGASVTVPPGAFAQPTYVWIRTPDLASLPALGPGVVALGPPVAIEAGAVFSVAVTIRVPFDPSLLSAVRAKSAPVQMYTFDPASSAFDLVPGASRAGSQMVASVAHFTIYQAGAVPADVRVQTLAGNGGISATSTSVDAWATPLPKPEWTAVNGAGHMFVSSYDGTDTRVFKLANSKLALVGTLRAKRGVGLVVNDASEAFLADGPTGTIWKASGGNDATLFAGGGSTAVGSTTTFVPVTAAALGTVRGLALDANGYDIYVFGSQYYFVQVAGVPAAGVRLLVPTFTRPPPSTGPLPLGICPLPSGSFNIRPLAAAVSPGALQSGAQKLLYIADGEAKTLDAVNIGTVPATVWPGLVGPACRPPISVPVGQKRTLLAPYVELTPTGARTVNPFFDLAGIAVDANSNLYFTERAGQEIRVRSGDTGCETGMAGNRLAVTILPTKLFAGECGFSGDGLEPAGAAFFDPAGVALTSDGDLLVADSSNHRLRLIFDSNRDTDTVVNGDGFRVHGPDNCPWVTNQSQADADGDGVGDVCDNCPAVANSLQSGFRRRRYRRPLRPRRGW